MQSQTVTRSLPAGPIRRTDSDFSAAFYQTIDRFRAARGSSLSCNRSHRLDIYAGQLALLLATIREGKRLNVSAPVST